MSSCGSAPPVKNSISSSHLSANLNEHSSTILFTFMIWKMIFHIEISICSNMHVYNVSFIPYAHDSFPQLLQMAIVAVSNLGHNRGATSLLISNVQGSKMRWLPRLLNQTNRYIVKYFSLQNNLRKSKWFINLYRLTAYSSRPARYWSDKLWPLGLSNMPKST